MGTEVIIYALDLSEAQINHENRTVTQRLISAGRSGNGRHYSEAVLSNAIPLFEGARSFSDHPTKTEQREKPGRSTRQITGWLQDVEYRENALWATRHFTRNQAGQDTWALVEDVITGKAPATLIGASINALGKARKDDESGDLIVESIDQVLSVDDVTTAAAGGGFMAEGQDLDLTSALLEAIDYDEWLGAQPAYVERLKAEWKIPRQTQAIKAAQAEADRLTGALNEAQESQRATQEDNAKLATEVGSLSRELLLERALRQVNLPPVWMEGLRTTLKAAPESEWAAIVGREKAKAAASAEPKQSIPISGAGQQFNEQAPLSYAPPRPRRKEAFGGGRLDG